MANLVQRLVNYVKSLWTPTVDAVSTVNDINATKPEPLERAGTDNVGLTVKELPSLFTFSSRKGADAVMAHVMDITKFEGGAIVNAANEQLEAGGGVCGAIFRASDFELLQQACFEYPDTEGVRCATGDAKITPSFGMPAPWIIHAVGPIWHGGSSNEPELLASAYQRCLEVANNNHIRSIAFPAISTGIYGFPLEQATKIAVDTVFEYVRQHPDHFDHIEFTCFNNDILNVYATAMSKNQLADNPEVSSNTP